MQLTMPPNDPITIVTTCDSCGGLMRLVGTEPHAVNDGVDLHTFTCTLCDSLQVTTVATAA